MSIAEMSPDIGQELAARARLKASKATTASAAPAAPTTAAKARLWKVQVHFLRGGRPMLATVYATSAKQALALTLYRHPDADTSLTAVLGPAS